MLYNVIKENIFMIFDSILLVCSQVIHEAYSYKAHQLWPAVVKTVAL